MVIVGFIVGMLHRYTSASQLDVFKSVDKGYMDPKPVPSSVLASLITLIGGFSMGPEVPSGMIAAGFGSWFSKKLKMDEKTTKSNVISGISSAYSGLFSAPFAIIIMMLESSHTQSVVYYGTLLIAGLSAAVGFGLFYGLGGMAYSPLLGILAPPEYHLQLWQLGIGVVLGFVAVPFALILPVMNRIFTRILSPINDKPVIRGTLGGLLLGLLGVALPTTIGLGTVQMPVITQQAVEIGVVLLLIFALAKIIALSGALSFGFIGGPIFPLLFVGSTLGSLIHILFPQIPLGLALGCMLVAVPAAVVPIPLAIAVIGVVVIGLPLTNVLPVLLASLVAYATTNGLILRGEGVKTDNDN
jgi:H+/Cl- antiporter ClcA